MVYTIKLKLILKNNRHRFEYSNCFSTHTNQPFAVQRESFLTENIFVKLLVLNFFFNSPLSPNHLQLLCRPKTSTKTSKPISMKYILSLYFSPEYNMKRFFLINPYLFVNWPYFCKTFRYKFHETPGSFWISNLKLGGNDLIQKAVFTWESRRSVQMMGLCRVRKEWGVWNCTFLTLPSLNLLTNFNELYTKKLRYVLVLIPILFTNSISCLCMLKYYPITILTKSGRLSRN